MHKPMAFLLLQKLCVLVLVQPVLGSKSFHTNCTLPDHDVNFFYSPPVRGTMDILWSCILTLFLSTWTVQHLNVPQPRSPQARKTRWRRLLWHLRLGRRKIKWMVITILIPEFVVGKSLQDLCKARKSCKDMREAKQSKENWTLTHSHFANMGGIVLRTHDVNTTPGVGPTEVGTESVLLAGRAQEGVNIADSASLSLIGSVLGKKETRNLRTSASSDGEAARAPSEAHTNHVPANVASEPTSMAQSSKATPAINNGPLPPKDQTGNSRENQDPISYHPSINGQPDGSRSAFGTTTPAIRPSCYCFASGSTGSSSIEDEESKFWMLNAAQWHYLLKNELIKNLPPIQKEDIQDKSKADAFVRVAAVVQLLWLWAQVITRAAKNLAVSQLEIVVLAFSFCAVLIFGLCWSKPQDVHTPIYVSARSLQRDGKQCLGKALLDHRAKIDKLGGVSWVQSAWDPVAPEGRKRKVDEPIRNDTDFDEPLHFLTRLDIGMAVGGTIFGGLHCVAWNFHFNTPLEKWWWRIASVLIASIPMCAYTLAGIFGRFVSTKSATHYRCMTLLVSLVYLVSRLFLIIDVMITLFFLPTDAFKATWATQFPHIA